MSRRLHPGPERQQVQPLCEGAAPHRVYEPSPRLHNAVSGKSPTRTQNFLQPRLNDRLAANQRCDSSMRIEYAFFGPLTLPGANLKGQRGMNGV